MDLLHWLEANIINHKTILHRKSALKYSTDFYIQRSKKMFLFKFENTFTQINWVLEHKNLKRINNFERLFLNHVILAVR